MFRTLRNITLGLVTLSAGTSLALAYETTSAVIDIQASVPVSCELSTQNTFSQIGADSFIVGSISRFCNTAHDIRIRHMAELSGGRISIGDRTVSLKEGSNLVVANSNPVLGSDDIILTDVDRSTAERVSKSLIAQISPSGL